MKNLVAVFFIIIFSSTCSLKNKVLDFCKMLEKDQSYLSTGLSDTSQIRSNLIKRKAIFIENFNIIIDETIKNGFPQISEINSLSDTCSYWGVTATLAHICQTRPDLFFSDKIVKLFTKEIEMKRMSNKLLFTSIRIGSLNKTCDTLKYKIENAIIQWELDPGLMNEISYKICN